MITRKTMATAVLGFGLLVLPAASFAESGEALYQANCAKCHGKDGKADTPSAKAMKAPAVNDPAIQGQTDLAVRIKSNKKHAGFVSKVTDAQVDAIVDYIKMMQ